MGSLKGLQIQKQEILGFSFLTSLPDSQSINGIFPNILVKARICFKLVICSQIFYFPEGTSTVHNYWLTNRPSKSYNLYRSCQQTCRGQTEGGRRLYLAAGPRQSPRTDHINIRNFNGIPPRDSVSINRKDN